MAKMNETRVTTEIGRCPACQAALEMVLRVELGDAKVEPTNGSHVTVEFEFAQPSVTGAVLKPHDCMRRDEPTPRPASGLTPGGSCRR
jgi:hypothetical protein